MLWLPKDDFLQPANVVPNVMTGWARMNLVGNVPQWPRDSTGMSKVPPVSTNLASFRSNRP